LITKTNVEAQDEAKMKKRFFLNQYAALKY